MRFLVIVIIIAGKRTIYEILLLINCFTVCADFYFIFFRNLLFLKNYSGNVEDLSLNFTVVNNELGESQVSQTKQPNSTTGIPYLTYLAGFRTFLSYHLTRYRSMKLRGVFLIKGIALVVGDCIRGLVFISGDEERKWFSFK